MKMKQFIKLFSLALTVSFFASSCNKDLDLNTEKSLEVQSNDQNHNHSQRTCGLDHYKEMLEQNPDLKREHDERINKYNNYANQNISERAVCSNPVIVPIAVHYQGVSSPNVTCLRSLAQTQVDILNQDYQGSNSDISSWNSVASSFPGISNGETCVEFVLANKNHPAGFGIANGDPAVTINKTSGDNNNSWSGYVNIFVQPNTGLLGYSPLGGAGNGDGVVVDASAFGMGAGCGSIAPQSPYNLGRTLTHELGHYMLLDHIWGNGCGTDDGVSDTPSQASEHYDCPNIGTSSCGSNDMFMNYMDYVNDNCMYMFSAGQSTRMENYIASNLQNVTNNASNVIDGNTSGGGGSTGGGNTSTCASPTDYTATGITTTSATINWTAQADAIKYRIIYRKVGTSSWTAKSVVPNTYTITDLQAGTTYQYAIKAQCPSGWQAYSPAKTFNTTSSNTGGGGGGTTTDKTVVKMKLTLDYYGSETSWELVRLSNNRVIRSGGTYQDGNSGQVINKTWSLPNGDYVYYIDDAYGDGICCDYGNGSVKILRSNNSVIGSSNGNFGTYDYIEFTVNNGSVSFNKEEHDEKDEFLAKKNMPQAN